MVELGFVPGRCSSWLGKHRLLLHPSVRAVNRGVRDTKAHGGPGGQKGPGSPQGSLWRGESQGRVWTGECVRREVGVFPGEEEAWAWAGAGCWDTWRDLRAATQVPPACVHESSLGTATCAELCLGPCTFFCEQLRLPGSVQGMCLGDAHT